MKTVSTPKAPEAIGPYSQAISAPNGFLYTSGQLGLDPETKTLAEGIENQATRALKNLEAILEAEGLTRQDVVKTTIFMTNLEDFGKVNQIYSDFFGNHKPARSTVGVASLPLGALFEIECIALKRT